MDETERLSGLIGDIYDAALDPALWPKVLEDTCGFIEGLWCALLVQDSVQMKHTFLIEWGADPHFTRTHNEIYAKLNPMVVPTILYAEVGSVVTVSDLLPLDEFRNSRFYREWLAPQGIVDAMAATLDKSQTSYAVVSVSRHAKNGMINAETRRRMELLAPHFRRAVVIGKVIEQHKVDAAALADVLDGITAGMLLVDAAGRIARANARGLAMLSEGTVIRDAGGKLATLDVEGNRRLHDSFANASADNGAGRGHDVSVPLSARDGERYVAHVLPLTSGARRRAGVAYSAVAAVFVRKAVLDLPHPLEAIANTFKLTPAEMRVLMMIVQVGGVPEVVSVLGVSEPTVKTHLQHVFQKTGTSRQADLVKLVAGYMSPLGGDRAMER
jgi:DNA-binding CsgD family transcriptional regulator/PAS domain-containing protein